MTDIVSIVEQVIATWKTTKITDVRAQCLFYLYFADALFCSTLHLMEISTWMMDLNKEIPMSLHFSLFFAWER